MSAVLTVVATVAAIGLTPAGPAPGGVSLELDKTQVTMGLGQTIKFTSTVKNPGEDEVTGAIAHLDVLAADQGVYVDPEDWSGERTQYLDPLDAGGSEPLEWEIQAVNSGHFVVYVVITGDQPGGAVVAGKTMRLDVAAERTLDVGGLFPIAGGIPGAIVLLMGVNAMRRRLRFSTPANQAGGG